MKRNHMLWIVGACLVMLVLFMATSRTGIGGLGLLGVLICPLIHLLMMWGLLGSKNKRCHGEKGTENQ